MDPFFYFSGPQVELDSLDNVSQQVIITRLSLPFPTALKEDER